ncbi:unnamed protein product, partial [Ectocarpus sp. 8 AP-2014]
QVRWRGAFCTRMSRSEHPGPTWLYRIMVNFWVNGRRTKIEEARAVYIRLGGRGRSCMPCANKVSRTSCKHQHRRALFREHTVHEHSLGPTTSMRRISHSEAYRCNLLVLSYGRQSDGSNDEGGSKV